MRQRLIDLADLRGTNLTGAALSNANLSGANLTGANLRKAKLDEARGLTEGQIRSIRSLDGAYMPDGTKHK
jgi:uncharacterized protein YjbI with pentapeptide repeats